MNKTYVLLPVVAAVLCGCTGRDTDYSKNAGATAWLAYHNGTTPNDCIAEMIEKYQTSTDINAETRGKAQSDALQLAGQTYAVSMASEKLVTAREEELALAREGLVKGYVVQGAVTEAITNLNSAIFDWKRSRYSLVGLDACDFTATDAQFGFQRRTEVYR